MGATGEIKAYIRNAKELIIDAEVSLRSERHHLSFLCSALSAENATSALIIALGRRTSKKHNNWMILGNIAKEAKEKLKKTLQEISIKLHQVEPQIPKILHYPFRLGETWLIPQEYYTQKMAEESLQKAKDILNLTLKILEELKIKT
ncbi:MAG: HEPN domain-containing protein [Candidatus Freyarchaeota archaeon]|nr:HEPN domain-containing protein [Candidatus Jordarchaeia archaeon]MBS7268218.1 HEPN domain-containing protein [Candidatus Jordarchaeia archaeon]MBS7279326.1 HEPN domain-containing protein [Candidatus Jordarchaeia archaeon]